jgi:hypothetical protein
MSSESMVEPGYLVLQAFVAALVVGCIVVLLTMAIERLGAIGGLIASAPSTVVVAAAAFAVQGANLVDALYMVPCGMVASVTFLVLWRQLPPICGRCVHEPRRLLVAMLLACIVAWFLVAIVIEVTANALADVVPVRAIGLLCLGTQLAIGLFLAICRPLPDRKADKKTTWRMYLARACAAGMAIFVADLLAGFSPSVGGVASTFPAIFSASMFAVSWSHGIDLSRSAIAPMALGSTSVGVYAVLFAELYPLLFDSLQSTPGALALALPITWLIAVVTTSLPIFLLLRWLKKRQPPLEIPIEALYEAEEEEVDYRVVAARHDKDDDDDLTALDNDSMAAGLLANAISGDDER